MDGTVLLTALALIVVGGALLFAGYRLFRLLAPVWGFIVGFDLATAVWRGALHTQPLAALPGWAAAIIVGLIFAALAYSFYSLAVVILGASVGYTLGQAVVATLFAQAGLSALVAGLIGAAALVVATIALDLPRALLVLLTALSGAGAAVAGVLLLFGWVSLATLQASLTASGSAAAIAPGWVTLLTLGLAVIGILAQAGHLRLAPYTHAWARRRASVYPPKWPRPSA
ncbi:MAG TPA: DUF4203 domain-containing protein [Ktedonobacterales bacterium]